VGSTGVRSGRFEYVGRRYRVEVDGRKQQFRLFGTRCDELLVDTPNLNLFTPVVDGDASAGLDAVRLRTAGGAGGVDVVASAGDRVAEEIRLEIRCHPDHVAVQAVWRPRRACRLYRYHWLPVGTHLNLYDLLNFRWGQYTDRCVEVSRLGWHGFDTSTDSTDWNFWPHPDLLVFQKHDALLSTFTKDLPPSFGTYIRVASHRVEHWHMDVGQGLIELDAGQEVRSPEFALQVTHGSDVYDAVDAYTGLLQRERRIPKRRTSSGPRWWRQPLYCTWLDQGLVAKQQWRGPWGRPAATAFDAVNDGLVNRALGIMQRERLPFASWILDDGWQAARGDWWAHADRFPNLRRTIDRLHEAGYKVVLWWAPMEFDPGCRTAREHPEWFAARNEVCNRHGRPAIDYSSPLTQQQYLEPLLRTFFSDEPGCYNADGVKYDFVADKVNPWVPVHDPAWIGEQRYLWHFMHYVQKVARRYKPDACMHAYCPHPYFNNCVDLNRTADVNDSNYLAHRTRGQMMSHLCPGVTVSYDFHGFREKFPAYLRLALEDGVPIQIGSTMGHASSGVAYTAAEYALLRRTLKRYF